jgi:lipopolysaccharide export system permease protein
MNVTLNIIPDDFFIFPGMQEQMNNKELKLYIERQRTRGIGNIKNFELEYEKRYAFPFAAFILTIIGLSLSSKKVKGGMGLNLALGLLLSILYILFYSISSTFTVNGSLSPMLATWMPNAVFSIIAAYLYRRAPK